MTVLPAIRSLGAKRSAHVGRQLRIEGSGFSRVPSENSVWLGEAPCTVISATLHEIVCIVMANAAAISAAEVTSPPPLLRSWNGPGLTLTQQHLNGTMPGCLTHLTQASTSECATAGSMPTLVHLRQQAVFPHHTPERHDAETGELLVTRPIKVQSVLLSTTAWFVPPSNGTYELSLQPSMACVIDLSGEPLRSGRASRRAERGRGCQSGRQVLQKGGRYPIHFSLVLGSSNEQLVLSASVESEDGSWELPAPAEWFEWVVAVPPDSTPIASVHVNGLQAVCRMAGGCAITVAPADMEHDHTVRSDRMLTTLTFGASGQSSHGDRVEPADEQLDAAPSTHRMLTPRELPGMSSQSSHEDPKSEPHDLIRRELLEGCPSGCCVVIFRGLPGEHCEAVPLWDFSGWSHPGGPFVQASYLCGTVRYNWLARSGQHMLQDNPQVSGRI